MPDILRVDVSSEAGDFLPCAGVDVKGDVFVGVPSVFDEPVVGEGGGGCPGEVQGVLEGEGGVVGIEGDFCGVGTLGCSLCAACPFVAVVFCPEVVPFMYFEAVIKEDCFRGRLVLGGECPEGTRCFCPVVVTGDDLPVIGGAVGECPGVICFGGEGSEGARRRVSGSHVEIVLGGVTGIRVTTGPGEGGGNRCVCGSIGWSGGGWCMGWVVGWWGECGE